MLKSLLALVAVLVLAAPATAGLTRSESSLLHEMNRVRVQHGLGPLRADAQLERAARAHNREMQQANAVAHGAFTNRMRRFAVTGPLVGENLAWGVGQRGTARMVVAAWLASPEHRTNLLGRSFTRVGVGTLVGPLMGFAGVRLVTADFAG